MKKLIEKDAIDKINNICNQISTNEETITFLGWAEKFHGAKTKLILNNSKYGTWKTTDYNRFCYFKCTHPFHGFKKGNIPWNKIDTDEAKKLIIGKFGLDRFDLSKFKYINCLTKVTLICHEVDQITGKEHGEFETYLNYLLYRSDLGCPRCSKRYVPSTEEFIEKANIIHENRYIYNKSEYKGYDKKLIVTCPEHGDFYITPVNHLKGSGCPVCGRKHSKGEERIEAYLINQNITYRHHDLMNSSLFKAYGCLNDYFVEIDFTLEYNNRLIWIEFNGEQHYKINRFFIHDDPSITFHRQLLRDLSVVNYARDNGIELLEIPYCDLSRVPEILDAFLERGENITTYVPRDLLSGPSLPLGLPLL